MCIFAMDKNTCMDAFRTQFAYFYLDMTLYAATVGATSYKTDGHFTIDGKFVVIIVQGKKEIESGGAEPFVEAICY